MYKYGSSGSTKSTKKRLTRHSDVMANEYAFIKRCSKNVNDHECKFHCSIRNINLSYAHWGINASTAAAMFLSKNKQFLKFQIREYYLAIGVDNTNSNLGNHNSIKSHAFQKIVPLYCLVVHVISCKMLLEKLEVSVWTLRHLI